MPQERPSESPLSPLLTASSIPAHRLNLIKEEHDYIPKELGEPESITDRSHGHLWNWILRALIKGGWNIRLDKQEFINLGRFIGNGV